MKLTDKVYCLAYRNHRYEEDDYHIKFFDSEKDRDNTASSDGVNGIVFRFEFRPIDIMKGEGNEPL